MAVSFEKLHAARRRCLVAGGLHKVDGLAEVLVHGEEIGIRPNVLVTDDQTARALLERCPSRERRSQPFGPLGPGERRPSWTA